LAVEAFLLVDSDCHKMMVKSTFWFRTITQLEVGRNFCKTCPLKPDRNWLKSLSLQRYR